MPGPRRGLPKVFCCNILPGNAWLAVWRAASEWRTPKSHRPGRGSGDPPGPARLDIRRRVPNDSAFSEGPRECMSDLSPVRTELILPAVTCYAAEEPEFLPCSSADSACDADLGRAGVAAPDSEPRCPGGG